MLEQEGHLEPAVAAWRRFLELKPQDAEGLNQLGVALGKQNKLEEARACFQAAIDGQGDYAAAYHNLGFAWEREGRVDQAVGYYQRAIQIQPDHVDARNNLANLLKRQGQLAEARACLEEGVRLRPEEAELHGSLGLIALLTGDFARGWVEYEWRWKCAEFSSKPGIFEQPMWDGRDPAGKTILLHAEQGFGDTIQFIRYASLLAARGARVMLQCPPVLAALMQRVAGVAQVVSPEQSRPGFDFHLPMLSLPLRFGTTLETIPAPAPYITPSLRSAENWRRRVARSAGGTVEGGADVGGPADASQRPQSVAAPVAIGPAGAGSGRLFFQLAKGRSP